MRWWVLSGLLLVTSCERGSLGVWSMPGHTEADAGAEPDLGTGENPPTPVRSPGETTLRGDPDAAPTPDTGVDLAPEGGLPDLAPDLARDARETPALTCSLTPSEWIGCNAACGVCGDMVAAFGLYLQNHPRCAVATTSCAGATRTCTSDCPLPTVDDLDCRANPAGWVGCIGSGCAIDPANLAGYPGYLDAHPFCSPGNATHSGNRVGCSTACPRPTDSDRAIRDGAADGWDGCRGYGIWVCTELLEGYPRYLANHPFCVANGTCAGLYFACSESCPAPGPADR